jgi:hypothetical protein
MAIGLVRGRSYYELLRPMPVDENGPGRRPPWIIAALKTWEAIENRDRDEAAFQIDRLAKIGPLDLLETAPLAASAMLVRARAAGLDIEPLDERVRVPPPHG